MMHLDPDKYAALLAGSLPPSEARDLSAHLAQECDVCERFLPALLEPAPVAQVEDLLLQQDAIFLEDPPLDQSRQLPDLRRGGALHVQYEVRVAARDHGPAQPGAGHSDVLDEEAGHTFRATILIDPDGKVGLVVVRPWQLQFLQVLAIIRITNSYYKGNKCQSAQINAALR